jgi:hypothetical protein
VRGGVQSDRLIKPVDFHESEIIVIEITSITSGNETCDTPLKDKGLSVHVFPRQRRGGADVLL